VESVPEVRHALTPTLSREREREREREQKSSIHEQS